MSMASFLGNRWRNPIPSGLEGGLILRWVFVLSKPCGLWSIFITMDSKFLSNTFIFWIGGDGGFLGLFLLMFKYVFRFSERPFGAVIFSYFLTRWSFEATLPCFFIFNPRCGEMWQHAEQCVTGNLVLLSVDESDSFCSVADEFDLRW